jgi:hypothetical protein
MHDSILIYKVQFCKECNVKAQNLDETASKVFNILVERFGRPIGESPSTVGVPDEREEISEDGPSKKTAKKILKGTKTFKDKVKKVKKWAKDPEAAAAWMMHKATGKWPGEH